MQPNNFFAVQRIDVDGRAQFQTTSVYRTLPEAVAAAASLRQRAPSGRWFVFSCASLGEFDERTEEKPLISEAEFEEIAAKRQRATEAAFDMLRGKR